MKKRLLYLLLLTTLIISCFGSCMASSDAWNQLDEIFPTVSLEVPGQDDEAELPETAISIPTEIIVGELVTLADLPQYKGKAYVEVNDNQPCFTESEKIEASFELYSSLDKLGRCGVTYACIGTDLMPTEEREPIGSVKPTGWHLIKYDCIEDLYLYNRCHLIGYQLSGENANTQNLITGTRYMNVEGMLPFENKVASYVKKTGKHVLYRVTPIFDGDNLLCHGVQMEAWSVEDNGRGICFNVFCYNVQPGIGIDYATGESWEIVELEVDTGQGENGGTGDGSGKCTYILNLNTKKFHYPSCNSVTKMKESNKKEFNGTRQEAIDKGYDPCGNCRP